ncbi:uncharacterized protein LOC125315830 [Rhodamnia argentea]|uniref:Uncharacterized protein LOC125315830 n=1 Tax=Rhodamnia argentea TaxID=178133 RepID=A0ABM3HMA8_9MYRT|nr:uncharacterized protein LOC125315830 [Rhodamnia argentea]
MSSVCISSCLNDARALQAPVRATYVNLYKWPESDAEFVRSMSSNGRAGDSAGGRTVDHHMIRTRVVDSISCRQMYLRSYPLSREENAPPDIETRCFGRRRRGKGSEGGNKKRKERRRRRRCVALRKVKEASWTALFRIFHGLLSCSASVDVVD